MDLITALSKALTIKNELIDSIQGWKEANKEINDKMLKTLTAGIDYDDVSSDLQLYAEAADEFVQSKHQNYTGAQLISDDERKSFFEGFYSANPGMVGFKYYVNPILEEYLYVLEQRLQKSLTMGEKFLANKITTLDSNVSIGIEQLHTGQEEIGRKIDGLSRQLHKEQGGSNKYLDAYFDRYKEIFEAKPNEEKAALVGNYSLSESFIDITIDAGKKARGVSAVEYIEKWAMGNEPGVRVIYGEPGHGKTTLGYRLVYDYKIGKTQKRVFFFPLVSPAYSIVTPNDTIDILNAFRLDMFDSDSKLEREMIENSLIILDGYDELQVALGTSSRFSSLRAFYDLLNEFANCYNTQILLTTRSTAVNISEQGMKQINRFCFRMNTMTDEQQNQWILEHNPDYMEKFAVQRANFTSVDMDKSDEAGNILGIPFVFILTVNTEFDEKAYNLVELYDKLFEATFDRKGITDKTKQCIEHLNYETLACRIYEQGDKRAKTSSLEEGIRVNLFAYSYYLTFKNDDDISLQEGYYEFYHRSFYEYFLAWSIYRKFLVLSDPDDFLYFMSKGYISEYVQKYLGQIVLNEGRQYGRYKDCVDNLIQYIEKTDCIIIRDNEKRSIDRSAATFVNAISCIRIFQERFIIHADTAERFSDYVDNDFCRLLRTYKCQRINLSNSIMVGGHFDNADFRMGVFKDADLSGKVYLSYARLNNAAFEGTDMESIDMYHVDAGRALFRNVNLKSSRLEDASFANSTFSNVDLRGANLRRANLSRAVLSDVIVDESTDFLDAYFEKMETDIDLSMAVPNFRSLVEEGKILFAVMWNVIAEDVNPWGSFTHRICWIPPKASGYIVQFVSVDDPLILLPNYEKPYYEAWHVESGVVEQQDNLLYDEEFSNEEGGTLKNVAIEQVQTKLREADVKGIDIKYRCNVYWVFDEGLAAETIKKWERNFVPMAGNRRASYDAPGKLGMGRERVYSVKFQAAQE